MSGQGAGLFQRQRGARSPLDLSKVGCLVMVVAVVFSLMAAQQLSHSNRKHTEKDEKIKVLEEETQKHRDSVHNHRRAVERLKAKLDSTHANLTVHAGVVEKLKRERDQAVGEDHVAIETALRKARNERDECVNELHNKGDDVMAKQSEVTWLRGELERLKAGCEGRGAR